MGLLGFPDVSNERGNVASLVALPIAVLFFLLLLPVHLVYKVYEKKWGMSREHHKLLKKLKKLPSLNTGMEKLLTEVFRNDWKEVRKKRRK